MRPAEAEGQLGKEGAFVYNIPRVLLAETWPSLVKGSGFENRRRNLPFRGFESPRLRQLHTWRIVMSSKKPLQEREIFLAAVQQRGDMLRYVDHEMCLEAVQQDGLALEYVPKELRDWEMCLEAVRQNSDAEQFAPETIRKQIDDSKMDDVPF